MPPNHQRPPFRAEHIGSLLRPQALTDRRVAMDGTKAVDMTVDDSLRKLEDDSIDDIVKMQLDLGYHAVTDGEFRRHQFWGTFFPALKGMEEVDNPPLEWFRLYVPDLAAFTEAGHKPGESIVCTSKIKHTGSTYIPQFKYLVSRVPASQVAHAKLTLPAPEWYHLRYRQGHAYPSSVYPNDAAYFADIAAAYRQELKELHAAGCRNVQIDDPNLAYFCSEKMLAGFKEAGDVDAEELLDGYIGLYNDCLKERPEDMHVALHLCRGNFAYSRHFSEGGYDRIAVKLFKDLVNVDTYMLEYDTERAGGFEPLKELPAHKNVILGVVTSKFPELEDVGKMKERVLEAADYVAEGAGQTREEALKRMGVSPQCGFASHHLGNSVNRQDMENKLRLVRQIAEEIWPGEP